MISCELIIFDLAILKTNEETTNSRLSLTTAATKSDDKSKDPQQQVEQPGKEVQDDEIKEIVFLPTSKDGDWTEFLKLRLPVGIDKFFELFLADECVFSSKERLALQSKFFGRA
mgnify:CR=1 FL=1